MKNLILFTSIICAVGFFVTISTIIMSVRKSKSLNLFYRMRKLNIIVENKKNTKSEEILTFAYGIIKRISQPLVEKNLGQSLEYKLKQAGLPLLGGEFIIISAVGMILVGLLVLSMTLNFKMAILASVSVPVILWIIVLILINRRLESFTSQLGDCLITISNALRAGYSFQQAVEIISTEMEPPISDEFSQLYHEISMGVRLEDALENTNRRVGSADFELVVTAVLIQREVGGNLAQILDNISDTIRERIRMKREILTLTAQGRFSAIVLLALPFAAGAAMYFLNHDNFMLLFEEPMGQIAIGVSIIMEVVGFFIIRRIVDIDA